MKRTHKFYFSQDPTGLSAREKVNIYLADIESEQHTACTYNSEERLLTLHKLENGGITPTFLELAPETFEQLVSAIIQYASSKNMRTENEHALLGKYTATKEHLEDMRKLVFKTPEL